MIATINPIKEQLLDINIFKKTLPPLPKKICQNPWYFIAFGFGSGASPIAPGTFGTLVAIPFYLLLTFLSLEIYIVFIFLFIIFSAWLCGKVSHEINIHDHPGMCIDEFAGFFVTMINAPHGIVWIAMGFILFRLFDIWKPWPIRWFDQKIQGGLGIVLDDVLAGLYAFICLQFIVHFY